MAGTTVQVSLASATLADLERARRYHGPRAWLTRDGEVGEHWIFERVDGGFDSFCRADLEQGPWWRFCDASDVLQLEAQLSLDGRPKDLFVERPISYVARSERGAGGPLIAGSLLSTFFEGEGGYESALATCGAMRTSWPDARVFLAASIAEAERCLLGVDVHAEKLERRTQEIRVEQAEARARLEPAK